MQNGLPQRNIIGATSNHSLAENSPTIRDHIAQPVEKKSSTAKIVHAGLDRGPIGDCDNCSRPAVIHEALIWLENDGRPHATAGAKTVLYYAMESRECDMCMKGIAMYERLMRNSL